MQYKVVGKRVLVTGGTGFIGRYLVTQLASMGNEVRVLARNTSTVNIFNNDKKVSIAWGDLRDGDSLRKAANGVDIVYHLAGKLHVQTDSCDPELHSVNVDGTKNLLDASVLEGVPQFIFFSSTAVIGNDSNTILDKTTPCIPSTEYGKSKLMAENLIQEYHEKYNLITTILRPVVVYGKGEHGNVIKLIKHIKKFPIPLIERGSTIKSLIYVRNVIEASLCVTNNPKANGQVYVITDGKNFSIKEVAEIIASKLNVSLSGIYIPHSVAYGLALGCEIFEKCFKYKMPFNRDILKRLITSHIFSSRKIQNELGFCPISFEDGIFETVQLLEEAES